MLFSDRRAAGRALAVHLESLRGRNDVSVLALPRGGIPVGFEVARALGAPLEPFFVRKLGVPGHEELAMGAIASGGVQVLNDDVVAHLGLRRAVIDTVVERELQELQRREQAYRPGGTALRLEGRIAVLVDDGLATGSTMKAAVQAARALLPTRVIVAVPVGAPTSCAELRALADEVLCAQEPDGFQAVGQFYEDFDQTTDDEVCALLAAARPAGAPA